MRMRIMVIVNHRVSPFIKLCLIEEGRLTEVRFKIRMAQLTMDNTWIKKSQFLSKTQDKKNKTHKQ